MANTDSNMTYIVQGEFKYDGEVYTISPYPVKFNTLLNAKKFENTLKSGKHSVYRLDDVSDSSLFLLIGEPLYNTMHFYFILIGFMLIIWGF